MIAALPGRARIWIPLAVLALAVPASARGQQPPAGNVAAGAVATPLPGIPHGWSDGYAYVNGVRLHYYRAVPAPGKPVMVMVHGVTDNGLSWTTLTRKLEDSYDVYMLDTRGHGLSDPFTDADDGSTLVTDVVEFVRAMGFEKPILMGHSMGGATVMRLGAEYPELARAIVMLDPPTLRRAAPGTGGAPPRAPAAAPSAPAAAPNRLSVSMMGSPQTLVAQNNYGFDDLFAKCRRDTPKWDVADCQYWALSKKQYHGPYTSEQSRAMTGTMAVGESLAEITVPALLLKADASPEVRSANEEAARVMKQGRLVHIDGAGHNLHHDDLERTVEVLAEFLSTL